MMTARIAGIGAYVPENLITNDDLAKIVDTNDEWIRTRTGIRERRISSGEGTRHLAAKAAERALAAAGVAPEELDIIILGTSSPDRNYPSDACSVQAAIGAGLSDFLGGYTVWVLPTMVLKGLWAFIAGTIAYKLLPNFKYSWLVGAIVGGIAHIIGYTLVKIPLYGTVVAFGEMFTLSMQTIAGIVLGGVVYTILVQSPAIRTLKAKFA